MRAKPIKRLIQAARGDQPADLLFCNARLVNVYLGEIQETDFAVAEGYIIGFGSYEARRRVDLKGRVVAPGFIDAHVHVESSMVSPIQYARAVLPCGTTAVAADPHEIANVLGRAGIDYMLSGSEGLPVHFFFTLPSCVPATAMETSGAAMGSADLLPLMDHPRIRALGEMMNFPGVIHEDPEVLAKLEAIRAHGKPADGHGPGLSAKSLNAYLIPGIASDHECTSVDEAREKLAAGMHIMVRQGSGARNLQDLVPLINTRTARRMMWSTDDRHPHDLLAEGHIDGLVRQAVGLGVDPILAIQMATLNPALYFHLEEIGALAPGKRADFVVFDDLHHPVMHQVYVAGRLHAEAGRLVEAIQGPAEGLPPATMHVPLDKLDFQVPARGARLRVIKVIPGQIITEADTADAVVRDGLAVSHVPDDLLKMVVVERHHGSGSTGVGFIRGFGLRKGALAASVAHDSHNIVAVGVGDHDLRQAVECLVQMGGGLTAVADGKVLARVPLPIAGLMSDQPVEQVRDRLDQLLSAAHGLGSPLEDPFMTLSFMALPVIPALKLTDKGLVDVARFEIVPLFIG
jgi:adenine deaminase